MANKYVYEYEINVMGRYVYDCTCFKRGMYVKLVNEC